MFGLGRRKDDELHRLQARGEKLSQQLEQVQSSLLEATKRAELAEGKAVLLASQNRTLAAKVHRLALQREELQNNHGRVLQENKELQITNLQLECETRVAKAAKADAWQVTNLKSALRQQAAQHEKKMSSLKRRTKALLSVLLPGGHSHANTALLPPGERSAPGSPASDSAAQDLWDAPLSPPRQVEYEQPDVHARIRQIVGWLYDDTLSEDQALEQMTVLTQDLASQPQHAANLLSQGCSPFPVPRLATEDAGAAAEKVDASTDMRTYRAHFVADVATETPAEISYIGTPRDTAATPSAAPTPSRRLGGAHGGVPALDLAALVAQAMEDVPLSGRSTASTTTGGAGSSSFNAFSQFVLAQPEKLQRLIMRHAAATGAKSGTQWPQQSPFAAGLMAASATAATATSRDLPTTTAGPSSLDPVSLSGAGAAGARSNFTARLLGLGGAANSTSSNRINIPSTISPSTTTASPAASNAGTAGVLMPSSAGNTLSPAKPAVKRAGTAGAPKLVNIAGASAPAPSKSEKAPAVVLLPGAKFLSGIENSSGAGGRMGVPLQTKTKMDMMENDFSELQIGGGSALTAFRSVGAGR